MRVVYTQVSIHQWLKLALASVGETGWPNKHSLVHPLIFLDGDFSGLVKANATVLPTEVS